MNKHANGALPQKRILRSIGAVLAGLVFIFVLSGAVDAVLHATGYYSDLGEKITHAQSAVAFAYRAPICIFGCYLAARLSPSRPMRHALILGVIGTVISIVGYLTMGDMGPAWYGIALAVTALPFAWVGGKIYTR